MQETQRKWEEEATGLREELSQLMSQLEHLDVSMRKMAASKQQMEEVIALEGQQTQEREEALQVKKRTLDLLPDAQNNIAKLQVGRCC